MSLTVVPANHGTLLPQTAQAASMSAVAAGSSGRRAKTKAAIATLDTENRTTLQPASRVAPRAGAVHVTSMRCGSPSVTTAYGIAAPGSGRGAERSVEIPSQASTD